MPGVIRAMEEMLYRVKPADLITLFASVVILGTVAGVAAYVPARHA